MHAMHEDNFGTSKTNKKARRMIEIGAYAELGINITPSA